MLSSILQGVVQGVAEWLPISSEGLVALVSTLTGSDRPVQTALFVHLGTLLAALVYYRQDWSDVLRLHRPRLTRFLTIATVVSLPIGFFFYTMVAVTAGSGVFFLTGAGLYVTAALHYWNPSLALGDDVTAVVTGVLQGFAAIPGVSRSGSTFFGLSLGSFDEEEVLMYSYMLSVPVTGAAVGYVVVTESLVWQVWPAVLASFLVGLATLHGLMRVSRRLSYVPFLLVMASLSVVGGLLL